MLLGGGGGVEEDQSETCLPVSIFSKNSSTGFEISVKIPKLAFQKPAIFQTKLNLS